METIRELLREAAPEAIGGIVAAAVGALFTAIWAACGRALKRGRGSLALLIYIGLTVVAMVVAFATTYSLLDGETLFPAEKIIVLVADFYGPDPKRYLLTDYFAAHLDKEITPYADDVELKALGRAISAVEGSQVARAEGVDKKAAIVIWGWYGAKEIVSVHFHLETLDRLRLQYMYLPVLVTDVDGQVVGRPATELDNYVLQEQFAREATDLVVGITLLAAYEWEDSVHYLTRASIHLEDGVLLLDDPSVIYFYRGSAYYYNKDYEQAVDDFNAAIDLSPNNAMAYHGRGFAYYEKGNYEQAISDATMALSIDPSIADAYYGRALAYAKIGEHDLAVEDYEKALDELHWFSAFIYGHVPQDLAIAEAYYQNGLRHANNRNFETAVKRFRRATLLNPDMAEAYFELGLVYIQLDDKQEAKSAFKMCLEKTDDPDLRRRAKQQMRVLRFPFLKQLLSSSSNGTSTSRRE